MLPLHYATPSAIFFECHFSTIADDTVFERLFLPLFLLVVGEDSSLRWNESRLFSWTSFVQGWEEGLGERLNLSPFSSPFL